MLNGIERTKTTKELIELGLLEDEGRFVFVMVNDKRTYTVNNPQGSAFSFGENSTNTVTNNNNGVSEELLLNLFKEIDSSELKNDEREELKELIEAAQAASEAEIPKQSVIRSMLDGAKNIMDTVSNSPRLIEAYTQWINFLQNTPTV
ncbi:hypothetical protein [Solibacillus cecembensis]|uniref:hypothetical protein n=1 Tax=Solibacillus cecembensis TaxID=459347 RepID=UPI003D036B57